jgi:DNA repair photolyase
MNIMMPAPAMQGNTQSNPPAAFKGRGTAQNPAIRFERESRDVFDDGWDNFDETPPPQTSLLRDSSRSIIARNDSPDIGFDRSINPYRGCEHGCIYCFARPTHAYLGLSPGLDFETKIVFKPEAAALLEKELSKPGYVAQPIVLGSNTDPYQPVERTLKLTRQILDVLERFNHPVIIVTKSAGVVRDADILGRMAVKNLTKVFLSVTTLDAGLARAMEPRAASPARRLAAIRELTAAKIPVGVFASPMIPGLNDAELEQILEAAAKAGANSASSILLRLPLELSDLFTNWLNVHMPDRAKHVLSLIRQVRGGSLNEAKFHARFAGTGPYAELLTRRFMRAARQFGLSTEKLHLDCSLFAAPNLQVNAAQLSLF